MWKAILIKIFYYVYFSNIWATSYIRRELLDTAISVSPMKCWCLEYKLKFWISKYKLLKRVLFLLCFLNWAITYITYRCSALQLYWTTASCLSLLHPCTTTASEAHLLLFCRLSPTHSCISTHLVRGVFPQIDGCTPSMCCHSTLSFISLCLHLCLHIKWGLAICHTM